MKLKSLIIILLIMVANAYGDSSPNLNILRSSPLGANPPKINANFGEYRGWGAYKVHDGIDFQTGDKSAPIKKVYPVESGTYNVHTTNDDAFGKYVIVSHTGFQTRYAHLSEVSVKTGAIANTNVGLGLSGNTDGGTNKSTGYHLHFGLGIPDVSYINTVNPIWAGLNYPLYGDLIIRSAPEDDLIKIRLLSPGKNTLPYV